MSLLLAVGGAEAISGSGGITLAVAALAASGLETFDATGAAAFSVAASSGSGDELFTGTADVAFAGPGIDGGEAPAVDGTGDVTFRAPAIWASGLGAPEEAVVIATPIGGRLRPVEELPVISGTASLRISAPRLAAIGWVGELTLEDEELLLAGAFD